MIMSRNFMSLICMEVFYRFSLVGWPSHRGLWDRQPCTGGNLSTEANEFASSLGRVICLLCTAPSMTESATGWDLRRLSGCCTLASAFIIHQGLLEWLPVQHTPPQVCMHLCTNIVTAEHFTALHSSEVVKKSTLLN